MLLSDIVRTNSTSDYRRLLRYIGEVMRILSAYTGQTVTRVDVLARVRKTHTSVTGVWPIPETELRAALLQILNDTPDTRGVVSGRCPLRRG